MKNRFIIPTLLFFPLLIGCNQAKKPVAKIVLEYVENGGVIDTNADQFYDDILNKKKSAIYILGDKSCGGCKEAKQVLNTQGKEKHFNSYYIEVAGMSTTSKDYEKIQQVTRVTNDDDMFKIGDMMPSIYFFFDGEVAFSKVSFVSDLEDKINKYIEVSVPNS